MTTRYVQPGFMFYGPRDLTMSEITCPECEQEKYYFFDYLIRELGVTEFLSYAIPSIGPLEQDCADSFILEVVPNDDNCSYRFILMGYRHGGQNGYMDIVCDECICRLLRHLAKGLQDFVVDIIQTTTIEYEDDDSGVQIYNF